MDQTTLAITERQGIEIDYCPECRGVWLDRGELDKLIAGGAEHSGPSTSRPPERYDERRDDSRGYDTSHGYHKKKKKESWLGDVFDF